MTYQEKQLAKINEHIILGYGRRVYTYPTQVLVEVRAWKRHYEQIIINPLLSKIMQNKVYCEIVDKNGNIFLSTKQDKKVEFKFYDGTMGHPDSISFHDDISHYINFRTDKKNNKINPEIFLILCEDLEEQGDVSLVYKTEITPTIKYLLMREEFSRFNIQYQYFQPKDLTIINKGSLQVYGQVYGAA